MELLEALATTRSIRRYRDEPIPDEVMAAIMFSATRAPSGSNRQPFRFIVLRNSPQAAQAKSLIANAAREMWAAKRTNEKYDEGSGTRPDSPKRRMANSMQHYVDNFERVPALILPTLIRYREPSLHEGASVYPACQNLLLAARGLGYGGVLTVFHYAVDAELRQLLGVPDNVFLAATITLGKPEGKHGAVRRRPLSELVFEDGWEKATPWAVDPPGTRHTQAGPPPSSANTPSP